MNARQGSSEGPVEAVGAGRAGLLLVAITAMCSACTGASAHALAPSAAEPLHRRLLRDPDDPRLNLQAAMAAEAAGDLLRATQYYERAEALGVEVRVVVPRIVAVLVKAGRYEEALVRCHRQLSLDPHDRAARHLVAMLLVGLDRTDEAERELRAILRDRPGDAEACLALGRLYRDLDRPSQARPMFERYLALAPEGRDAPSVRFELMLPDVAPSAPREPAP